MFIVCRAHRVNPQYLMYRPANSVPYATVESDLKGVFLKYCMMDPKGRLITRNVSEVEQKCSAFQHWIHQWTHGNLLVTRMEGKTHIHDYSASDPILYHVILKVPFDLLLQVLE